MPPTPPKPHQRIADQKRKARQGPVFLRNSFRPFFLAAGVSATLAVPLWVFAYNGMLAPGTGIDDPLWHQHEMLFGFAGAAIAGFILTAIPNWTGRLAVSGWRLGLLVALWGLGRLGFLASPALGPFATAVLDLPFLSLLVLFIGRELVLGRNARNLPVLVLIGLFTAGNWLVHLETTGVGETAETGIRLSVWVLALLVAVIGGRIVPSFTRNWLVRQGAETLPAPMGSFDKLALVGLAACVIAQVTLPDHGLAVSLALLAGFLHAVRLLRWKTWAARGEPLIWVLHLGYAWLVVALVLTGAAGLTGQVPQSAALHALTTGAFGTMILAVMTRASLGHTGRDLSATPSTTVIFVLVTLAALARVSAPFAETAMPSLVWLATLAWTSAYGLFVMSYYPVLAGHPPAAPSDGQ